MPKSDNISRTRLAGLSAKALEEMLETRRVGTIAITTARSPSLASSKPRDLGSLNRMLAAQNAQEIIGSAREWTGNLPLDLDSLTAICRASPYSGLTLFVSTRLWQSSRHRLVDTTSRRVVEPTSLKQILSGADIDLELQRDGRPLFTLELSRSASRLFCTLCAESTLSLVERLDPVDNSLIQAVAQLRQIVNHNPEVEQFTTVRRSAQRALAKAQENGRWTAAWAAQVAYAAASNSNQMLSNVLSLEEMVHSSYRQTLLLEWQRRELGGQQPAPEGSRSELQEEQFIRLIAVLLAKPGSKDRTLA